MLMGDAIIGWIFMPIQTVHADDNDLDYQGFHALHYAVMYHKADSIRELLLQCSKFALYVYHMRIMHGK